MPEPSEQDPDEKKSFFGESNAVDPTPGWIPFVFVIGFAVVFLFAFVIAALFWR